MNDKKVKTGDENTLNESYKPKKGGKKDGK